MMPQIAPAVVVRFHQMPMTSAGKLPAMASENAQPTMARMSDGLVEAVAAAATATSSSRHARHDQPLGDVVGLAPEGADHRDQHGEPAQQQPSPVRCRRPDLAPP